jgi:hypothetical protein
MIVVVVVVVVLVIMVAAALLMMMETSVPFKFRHTPTGLNGFMSQTNSNRDKKNFSCIMPVTIYAL